MSLPSTFEEGETMFFFCKAEVGGRIGLAAPNIVFVTKQMLENPIMPQIVFCLDFFELMMCAWCAPRQMRFKFFRHR